MKNGLACNLADVQPDIEPFDGGVLFVHLVAESTQKSIAHEEFIRCQGEVVRRVPARNHKRMKRRNRVAVSKGIRQIFFVYDTLSGRMAEHAFVVIHSGVRITHRAGQATDQKPRVRLESQIPSFDCGGCASG